MTRTGTIPFLIVIAALTLSLGAGKTAAQDGDEPQADSASGIVLILESGDVRLDYTPENIAELFRLEGINASPESLGFLPETPLAPGGTVTLKGVSAIEASIEIEIPAPIVFKYEFAPENTRIEVARPGIAGLERVSIRKYYRNDELVGESKRHEVIKNADARLVIMHVSVGKHYSPTFEELLHNPLLSREIAPPARYAKKLVVEATAYYPGFDCNGKWGNLTKMGYEAKPGRIAVDPRVIPLGSRLFVETYGYCVAVDTGGAIKGNRIDLCFETREECIQFGRRKLVVYVLL